MKAACSKIIPQIESRNTTDGSKKQSSHTRLELIGDTSTKKLGGDVESSRVPSSQYIHLEGVFNQCSVLN